MKKIYPFRIFTFLIASFLIGIAVFPYFDFELNNLVYSFLWIAPILLTVAYLNWWLNNKELCLVSFCLIFFLVGIVYYSYIEQKIGNVNTGRLELVGTIVSAPIFETQKQTLMIKPTLINETDYNKAGLVKVIIARYPEYKYGDSLKIRGILTAIEDMPPALQKNFKAKTIVGEIKELELVEPQSRRLTFAERTKKSLYYFNSALCNVYNKLLPEPHSSLSAGLLLGNKANFSKEFLTSLSATGLSHITALSGYNITIIIIVIFNFFAGLYSRKKTFVVTVFVIIGFVLMTGSSASAVRASIFAIILMIGKLNGRKADMPNLILSTALIMVLLNPNLLNFDIGFQLSFIAFLGLVYVTPVLELLFAKKFSLLPQAIKATLFETLSAQTAVFPLIMIAFGTISVISPIANLLVLWVIPLSMLFCFISGLSGLIFLPIGKFFTWLLWPVLEYIVLIIENCAKVPFSSFNLKVSGYYLLPIYLLMTAAIYLAYKKFNSELL